MCGVQHARPAEALRGGPALWEAASRVPLRARLDNTGRADAASRRRVAASRPAGH